MALRLIETVDAAKYDSEVQSLSAVEVFLDLLGDFPLLLCIFSRNFVLKCE